MTLERDWTAARAKVDREAACRGAGTIPHPCGGVSSLQAAHTIGRCYDRRPSHSGIQVGRFLVVRAIDVIPACPELHGLYDAGAVDILPVLTKEEQAAGVAHVGLYAAALRFTGKLSAPDLETFLQDPDPAELDDRLVPF